MGATVAKFDYDDVYQFELSRRRARREIGGQADTAAGCFGLLVLGAVIAFFRWVHGAVSVVTGPDVATWVVWIVTLSAIAGVVWLVIKSRMESANAARRADAEGQARAKEAIIRAKGDRPGLFAEAWEKRGHQQVAEADLLELAAAQQMVVQVYGEWALVVLVEQGHQRVVEDDVCAVFGTDRGILITDGIRALIHYEQD